MKNYRRYKNHKIETICQMEVIKRPKPTPLSEFQKWMFRGMQNCLPQQLIGYGLQPQQQQTPDWLSSLLGSIGGGVGPN